MSVSVVSAEEMNSLRVCADPNNLPFSNSHGAGFENKLAELIAGKLGKEVSYVWWAQRRGFVRHTLKADDCDVVMGVPAHYELVETTKPYYRSSYVFVSKADRNLDIATITDQRLRQVRIGVHLIGDDGTNTPPAHALGSQGIVDNVVGYTIYGDYTEPNPPLRLIDAVENGTVDVAAVWGPFAGFAARHSPVPLRITPIQADERFAPLRFQFDIAMGVRHGEHALRDRLDQVIDGEQPAISDLLRGYGVPLMPNKAAAASQE
jgi:mxaJ protein